MQAFECYGGCEDVHIAPTYNIGGYLRDIYQGLGGCVENKRGDGFNYGKYWH